MKLDFPPFEKEINEKITNSGWRIRTTDPCPNCFNREKEVGKNRIREKKERENEENLEFEKRITR